MAFLTPLPVFGFNGMIFIAINVLWVFFVEVFVRIGFELYLTRQLLQGRVLRIQEMPLGPFSFHAFTDGSRRMGIQILLLFMLFFAASLTLEFGFDADTYFTYTVKSTSILALNQDSGTFNELRDRGFLLENTGYYIANMNSCLDPMDGHLEQYESNSSSLPLTRRYSGDFKIYFPVTRQNTGQPYCSSRGAKVKGAVVMFVGISADRDRGLNVKREENINPHFVNLERDILQTLAVRRSVPASTSTFVDASLTVRNITVAPGIVCKMGQTQRQLCFIELQQPYEFRKDVFTHALVQKNSTDPNKWFAHALVRQPDSVQQFADHGWYKTYGSRIPYRVEHMPMALIYLDEEGLSLGPSFSVLHSVGHLLGAGPGYRFSVRRKFGLAGEDNKVRNGITTGATISFAGCAAMGAHGLLLLIVIAKFLFELGAQFVIRRRRKDDPTAANVKDLPYRAVKVSRRWLEHLVGRSERSFHVAGDDEVRLFVAVVGDDIAKVELLVEADAEELMRARGQYAYTSLLTLFGGLYTLNNRRGF